MSTRALTGPEVAERVAAAQHPLRRPRNEDLPAGSPMWFECVGCGSIIIVPECYVIKVDRCSLCGGEWSDW